MSKTLKRSIKIFICNCCYIFSPKYFLRFRIFGYTSMAFVSVRLSQVKSLKRRQLRKLTLTNVFWILNEHNIAILHFQRFDTIKEER